MTASVLCCYHGCTYNDTAEIGNHGVRRLHVLSDEQLDKIVGGVTLFGSFEDLELALTATGSAVRLPISKPILL